MITAKEILEICKEFNIELYSDRILDDLLSRFVDEARNHGVRSIVYEFKFSDNMDCYMKGRIKDLVKQKLSNLGYTVRDRDSIDTIIVVA